jgi:hypothetical protein
VIDTPAPPAWDPPPPRPRLILTWIGLFIAVAVVVTLTVVLRSGLRHEYAKGPAPCDRIDVSGVRTALGGLPPATDPPEVTADQCRYFFRAPDTTPVAMASVSLVYTDNAFGIWYYERLRKVDPRFPSRPVDDLGDTARLTVRDTDDSGTCELRLIVLDSNLRAEVSLVLSSDQDTKPCARLGELDEVALRLARETLAHL